MFPLHQGNELCFKISSNHNQLHNIPQDLNLDFHHRHELLLSFTDASTKAIVDTSRQRKSISTDTNNDKPNTRRVENSKRLMHRDIERQRRQEMATLYASLRSLLPLEYIKGKRSTSDHMSEAVNYIKNMKKRIKELDAKRNELKQEISLRDFTSSQSSTSSSTSSQTITGFIVRPCLGGIEIVFSSGLNDKCQDMSLSRVLKALLEVQISVLNCVSTKVNERIFHTVQAEVIKGSSCVNMSELQQKLNSLAT